MQGDNSGGVELCQLRCCNRLFDRKKMSHFGELVDDDEDSIISTLGLRKTSHEVHFDMIKLPFWNSKRLEKTSWSLVFCFHPSADITLIHELSDLTLHSSLPIRLLEVMVHLRTSRMNRQERIVRFIHNDFTKITLWNHYPVLEEKSISVIKSIALVFGDALFNTTFHLLHPKVNTMVKKVKRGIEKSIPKYIHLWVKKVKRGIE